tara:strand:- start:447 stop:728 length:282 start_codon:yes stop_codon:yes gene_type:complete
MPLIFTRRTNQQPGPSKKKRKLKQKKQPRLKTGRQWNGEDSDYTINQPHGWRWVFTGNPPLTEQTLEEAIVAYNTTPILYAEYLVRRGMSTYE